jgi:hypothetical protein
MENAYTLVFIQFFTLTSHVFCDIFIPAENRHIRFPLIPVNAVEGNNFLKRLTMLQRRLTPGRLATHLLHLNEPTLCNHLQMVIVGYLKNSLEDDLNRSIAFCISLMFGTAVNLEANYREALGYASRTAGTAMDYYNGTYRSFMLQLTQTIPTEIQQMILNNLNNQGNPALGGEQEHANPGIQAHGANDNQNIPEAVATNDNQNIPEAVATNDHPNANFRVAAANDTHDHQENIE